MNKVAIAAAALLVIALLAMPGVVGSITEARVRERVAAIDASPSAAAELTSFDRGWFRSTARIELELAPDNVAQLTDAAGTPLGVFGALPIVVEFAHGPVAVLDGVHFGWSKMVARPDVEAPGVAELTQTLGVPYLFEFRGRRLLLRRARFRRRRAAVRAADRRGAADVLRRDARRRVRRAPARGRCADRLASTSRLRRGRSSCEGCRRARTTSCAPST